MKVSGTEVKAPLRFEDLAPEAQAQYKVSEAQLESYLHTMRQMHQILALDGVKGIVPTATIFPGGLAALGFEE